VQEYLASPMLCDGLKFDLRLYVVVRSLQPLQVSAGVAWVCRGVA
jgi:hypothetical protein